jgi:DNA repair exonuclease SbcCD ATPase subunit
MQIDSLKTSPAYQAGGSDSQSVSIDQKIEKLEKLKQKIEQDLQKRSTNPDPEAARGDDAANSAVNQRILQQLEKQIQTLEQQRGGSDKENSMNSTDSNNSPSKIQDLQGRGYTIDMMA